MNEIAILQRLDEMIELLRRLAECPQVKDWYSTAEFALLNGLSDFTVREYCRLGRLNAKKQDSGRGNGLGWVISHAELLRYQEHGLLPPDNTRNQPTRGRRGGR